MKKIATAVGVVMAVMQFFAHVAFAEVPNTINLQSVVYDPDGNVTEANYVNVSVQIVDEAGTVYFQEDSNDVPVVQGAMNLIVGENSGGIPETALDPTQGRKFVNILVDGANPYGILPLSSVPYAMWADTAVAVVPGSIDGTSIKEGSIELKHLSTSFNINELAGTVSETQIPENIVRKETFDMHVNSSTAHQATTIVMNTGGAFAAQLGATVQIALETLYSSIVQEVANRQTAITNLSTQTTNSINNLQTQITANDHDISTLQSTVSNHTSRIGTLESNVSSLANTANNHEMRLQSIENSDDSREQALGWGVVNSDGNTVYGFNAGGSSKSAGINPIYDVSFSSPASDDNVVVMATSMGPRTYATEIEVLNVNRNGFQVICSYGLPNSPPQEQRFNCISGFHWVAYGNH